MMIHPRAVVQDATIGEGTRIWQFASVIRGSIVGTHCNIASGTTIDGARLGDRCIVGHNCSINPGVIIGNDVFIGPGVVFCNDNWPSVSKEGFDIEALISGQVATILVEDKVSIGARVLVLPGIVIGEGAFITGGVVVDRRIPPHCILWRNGAISPKTDTPKERMRPVSC